MVQVLLMLAVCDIWILFQHDSGMTCAPYGTSAGDASQGNYIMYASATKGNQPHNDEFSPCSKDNMTRVMEAVFEGRFGKVNCFKSMLFYFVIHISNVGMIFLLDICDSVYMSNNKLNITK